MAHDAHSSLTVVLPNAGHRLVRALATLWDDERPPGRRGAGRRRAPADRGPAGDHRAPRTSRRSTTSATTGRSSASTAGIDGTAALHALTFKTTLNLQGLWSGHTDATPKTVTPAEAHARLDIRLVPDQDPRVVIAALRRHLDEHGFRDIHMIVREAEPAWWTPPSTRSSRPRPRSRGGRRDAGEHRRRRCPGTVPMYQVCAQHRVPATTLGAGRADCRAHAPDENIRIDDLVAATKMMGRFMDAFARLPEVPRVP